MVSFAYANTNTPGLESDGLVQTWLFKYVQPVCTYYFPGSSIADPPLSWLLDFSPSANL